MEKVKFPIVRNISPLSISNDIIGMTSEETRENLEIIFKDFEKITGFVPTIVGDKSPINILFKKNRIMKNFREELFKYLYEFDYVTKDRDGEIHLWKGRPKWSESGDYWVSDGSFMCIDDGFEFSEFEDVHWKECIISLNPNNDLIEEILKKNEVLNSELSKVREKIESVIKIADDIELKKYYKELRELESSLTKDINKNLVKIEELKIK
jgi:hypothetical protein